MGALAMWIKSSADINRARYSSFLLQILTTPGNTVDSRKTHNKRIDGPSLEKKREMIQMNNEPDPLFHVGIHKASFGNKIHTDLGSHSYQNFIQHNSWIICNRKRGHQ